MIYFYLSNVKYLIKELQVFHLIIKLRIKDAECIVDNLINCQNLKLLILIQI